jgi:AcrR family transcriptional regulator
MTFAVITSMTVPAVAVYDRPMSRWEPNARGRLEQAALKLYSEAGFENTTVAEIARLAGLSERTFFRHYADKREVLFGGTGLLHELLAREVADAPAAATPMEAVGAALREMATVVFEERREVARRRQVVIDANPELQERELVKLASLARTLAEALRARGAADPAARLAAESGITVFKVAFQRWIDDPGQQTLPQFIAEAMDELIHVTGNRAPAPRP